MAHMRQFHLHVSQRSDRIAISWRVTRTLWKALTPARCGDLGRGEFEVTVEDGTTHEVALALLRIALEEYARQIS